MESYNKIAGGSLVRFSPQQLLDCASTGDYENMGCEGGHAGWTWAYLIEHELVQWEDYPYIEREDYCKDTSIYRGAKIKDAYAV